MKKILSVLLVAVLMLGVLVACNNIPSIGEEPSALENAKSYLQTMYKDKSTTTAADFERVGVLVVDGVKYTVTWTVDVTEGITISVSEDGKTVHFDVDEESSKEIPYTLTATISDAEGQTIALEFKYTIPKFAVTSFADYMAAKEGDTVVVEGIVVGINSKAAGNTRNHLFIMDESGVGGYYSYQMEADPVADLGIAVGMTVRVTGPVTPYNGMQEIKGGVATVLDTNIKEFAPVDITEKWVEGTDFNQFVALPVVVKGVTLGGQELANATSQYLFFSLNGVEGYVRTYVTDFPTTLKAEDKGTIDAAHAEKFGYVADVTGILITYSGKPYLIPTSVDCFYNVTLPERNDAEKVAFEKENLSFATTISKGGEMDLPGAATYSDVVSITWESNSELAVVNGNKLNITIPTETATIKLTATITCGEATDTKEFEVKILAGSMTYEQIVDAAYGLAVGEALEGTYRLFGVITSVDTAWSDQYSNITVTIQVGDKADKPIQCFRLKGDGAKDLKVGDAITVDGVLKNYNGKIEFDAGCQLVGMGEVVSQGAILDIAYALQPGEVTEESYTLTGVISSVDTPWSDQYSNITVTIIVDGNTEKPMMCFRLKGEGAQGLKVGDTITVTGTFTNYNGTIEFNAGCTLDKLVPGEGGEQGGEEQQPVGDVTTNAGVEIKEGVAYLMSMNQVTNGHTVYVCGGIDQDRYLVTSTDKAAALQIFVEKTDAGYKFYTTIDGAKKYINVTTNDAGKTAVLYQDTCTSVYKYVSETNIWVTTLDGQDKYLGSYQGFDTISASNTSYINAGNTGVSQFPLELIVAE